MERELKAEKRINRAVMVLIVMMVILLGVLMVNIVHLEKQYEQLEGRYIELYEKMAGGDITGLGNIE